jgi:hypothetical protein
MDNLDGGEDENVAVRYIYIENCSKTSDIKHKV